MEQEKAKSDNFEGNRNFVRSRKRFKVYTWKYKKNITPISSFILLVNQIFGFSMNVLPNTVKKEGLFRFTFANFTVCLACLGCSLMLLKAMTLLPHNERFEQRIEYDSVAKYHLSSFAFRAVSLLHHIGDLLTIALSLCILARVVDFLFIKFIGFTLSFQLYPNLSFNTLNYSDLTTGYPSNNCPANFNKGYAYSDSHNYTFNKAYPYSDSHNYTFNRAYSYNDSHNYTFNRAYSYNDSHNYTFDRAYSYNDSYNFNKGYGYGGYSDGEAGNKRGDSKGNVCNIEDNFNDSFRKSRRDYDGNYHRTTRGNLIINITVGYLICSVICLKLSNSSLQETIKFHFISFVVIVLIFLQLVSYSLFQFNHRGVVASHSLLSSFFAKTRKLGLFRKSRSISLFKHKGLLASGKLWAVRRLFGGSLGSSRSFTRSKLLGATKRMTTKEVGSGSLSSFVRRGVYEVNDFIKLLFTFVDNYNLSSNLPCWVNEVNDDVNVNGILGLSVFFCFLNYSLLSLVFARPGGLLKLDQEEGLLNNLLMNNLFELFFGKGERGPTEFLVGLNIILFIVITCLPDILFCNISNRYNLINLGLFNKKKTFFAINLLPFFVSFLFLNSPRLTEFLDSFNLGISLVCNFFIPVFIFISSCKFTTHFNASSSKGSGAVYKKSIMINRLSKLSNWNVNLSNFLNYNLASSFSATSNDAVSNTGKLEYRNSKLEYHNSKLEEDNAKLEDDNGKLEEDTGKEDKSNSPNNYNEGCESRPLEKEEDLKLVKSISLRFRSYRKSVSSKYPFLKSISGFSFLKSVSDNFSLKSLSNNFNLKSISGNFNSKSLSGSFGLGNSISIGQGEYLKKLSSNLTRTISYNFNSEMVKNINEIVLANHVDDACSTTAGANDATSKLDDKADCDGTDKGGVEDVCLDRDLVKKDSCTVNSKEAKESESNHVNNSAKLDYRSFKIIRNSKELNKTHDDLFNAVNRPSKLINYSTLNSQIRSNKDLGDKSNLNNDYKDKNRQKEEGEKKKKKKRVVILPEKMAKYDLVLAKALLSLISLSILTPILINLYEFLI